MIAYRLTDGIGDSGSLVVTADTSKADILSWFLPDMGEREGDWLEATTSIHELWRSFGATEPRWDVYEAEFLGIDVEVVE